MQFIQEWKENRLAKKIQKTGRHLSSKTSSRDSRLQSIDFLKDIQNQDALQALLQRFRFTAPELTQDEEEKDYVASLIRARGQAALEPLKTYIRQHDEIVYPLSLLGKLVSEEEMIDFLIDVAAGVGELYSGHKTIKLVELLRYLSRFRSPALVDFATTYLTASHDDEVIIAAIDILQQQADERARTALIDLAMDQSTTQRIIYRLGELFVLLQWSIKGGSDRKQFESRLKPEYYVVRGGLVKRKNQTE